MNDATLTGKIVKALFGIITMALSMVVLGLIVRIASFSFMLGYKAF